MYPVTAGFLEQVSAATQQIVCRVDITDPTGLVLATAPALAGSVTEEVGRSIRRTCQVTLLDTDGTLAPTVTGGLLAPLGNELRLYRGFRIPLAPDSVVPTGGTYVSGYEDIYEDVYSVTTDALTWGDVLAWGSIPTWDGAGAVAVAVDEWCPLGVFGISRPSLSSDDGGVVVTVEGFDRSRRIQRALFTDPVTIAVGVDIADAVQQLLTDRWPDCPDLASLIPDGMVTATQVILDARSDPWQGLTDLVTAYGLELFFDQTGVPVLRQIPDPANGPAVADYVRGMAGVIASLERALDDEGAYSGVIVVGESTGAAAPVQAVVWDDDPTSPTYYLGAFGQVPYVYTTTQVTTTDQATVTAVALLPTVTGVLEDVEHTQLVNPALECGDLVTNTDPVLGVSGTFSLERITTPLEATGLQSVKSKARRLA